MTAQIAVSFLLALASFAAGQRATEKDLPGIATPEALTIEMAKALFSGDRNRVTALAATRMEALLEAAQPPSGPEDRQYLKTRWLRSSPSAEGISNGSWR